MSNTPRKIKCAGDFYITRNYKRFVQYVCFLLVNIRSWAICGHTSHVWYSWCASLPHKLLSHLSPSSFPLSSLPLGLPLFPLLSLNPITFCFFCFLFFVFLSAYLLSPSTASLLPSRPKSLLKACLSWSESKQKERLPLIPELELQQSIMMFQYNMWPKEIKLYTLARLSASNMQGTVAHWALDEVLNHYW